MIEIYHVKGTRSVRPIWLCYELELPVKVVTIDFSESYRSTDEWRAISPAGKVPALTDGNLTMFESGAMIDHLLERYGDGALRPAPGTADGALYHQWCWFSESTLLRPLGLNRIMRSNGTDLVSDAIAKAETCLGVVEDALREKEYLVGSAFTAADIMMGYALGLLAAGGVMNAESFPAATRYLDRLQVREAYERAASA